MSSSGDTSVDLPDSDTQRQFNVTIPMTAPDKCTVCIVMGGHFSATIGGAQFQAQCIVEGLKQNGNFSIYYLARAVNPDYKPTGYEIIKIADPTGIRKLGFSIDTPRLLGLLKRIKPDVVYQRGLKAYTGVIAYYGKKTGCKTIFHIAHDDNVQPVRLQGRSRLQLFQLLDKCMGEYGLRNVDKVIAQSQFQADALLRNYGRSATAVIPNFHPVPEEPIVKVDSEVRVLWVANFKSDKRPEIFVQLARDLLHRKDIRFVMIGRPGDDDRYALLHSEIKQLPNLTYLGEQPIEEVNRQLLQGHIFVNTSRAEGFPNTFIQAWMRQVPTISLDVDPDGVLSKANLGYCCGTYERLRNQVVELVDNKGLRERMGAAGQKHALDVHSPKAVEKLIEIFNGNQE